MKCPRCGGECERDEVDNGVGMEACGPWGCPECHWVQSVSLNGEPFDPYEDDDPRTVEEIMGSELPHEKAPR